MEYFQGFTSNGFLCRIQKDLKTQQTNPEQFEGMILFMWMFNDIDWTKNGNFILHVSRMPEK